MKNKFTIIDLIALVIIAAVIAIGIFALVSPKKIEGEPTRVTISVSKNADIIYKEAAKLKEVYFDNTNQLVKVESVTRNNDKLIFVVDGPGKIEKDRYLFNGLEIYIGQKAELRGKYLAQGLITNIEKGK